MKPARTSTGSRRNPETHKAIIKAAQEVLKETGDLAFEEIARRSGAGKATIYRWWPQKIDLLVEVYGNQFKDEVELPDFGDMKKELFFLISSILRNWQKGAPTAQALLFMVTKIHMQYPTVKELRARFMPEQRDSFHKILLRGSQRGQLRPGMDLEVVGDMIFGFTWHCLLSNLLNPEDPQIQKILDVIFHGICAGEQRLPEAGN